MADNNSILQRLSSLQQQLEDLKNEIKSSKGNYDAAINYSAANDSTIISDEFLSKILEVSSPPVEKISKEGREDDTFLRNLIESSLWPLNDQNFLSQPPNSMQGTATTQLIPDLSVASMQYLKKYNLLSDKNK